MTTDSTESTDLPKGTLAYIEDNDADAMMIETAIQQSNCLYTPSRYVDVTAFLDQFGAAGADKGVQPGAILLDINLPNRSGFEILETVRQTFTRREVPIAVFSGGENKADITRAYNLGANLYLNKPMNFPEYRRRISGVCDFFIRLNRSVKTE